MGIQIESILSSTSDAVTAGNYERTDFERGKPPGQFCHGSCYLSCPVAIFASVSRATVNRRGRLQMDRRTYVPFGVRLFRVQPLCAQPCHRPTLSRPGLALMPLPGAATSIDHASYAGKYQYDG
jgi:hypothetical protein